jgi:hypothetical protein
LVKNLLGIFGSDFDTFLKHFYSAAYATSEAGMEANWALAIQVSHVHCISQLGAPHGMC